MIPHPEDGAGPRKFPTQGHDKDHQEIAAATGGWDLETLGEAGFEEIKKSVTKRQNTFTQYIATRLILDLCERCT